MSSSASISGGIPHDINVYTENPVKKMAKVVLEPLETDWETIPDRTNILTFIQNKFAEHGMDPESIVKVDGHVQRDGGVAKYDDEGERNPDWDRQAPVLDCYRHKGRDCLKGTIEWTITVEDADENETSYTFKQVLYTLEKYSNDAETQERAKERALIGLNCAVKAMKSGVYALAGNYEKAGLDEDNCAARVNEITNSHIFRVSPEHPRGNAAPTIYLLENADSAPTSITLKPLSQYKWTVIEGNRGYYTQFKDDDSESEDVGSESSDSSENSHLSFYEVIIRSARNTIVRPSQSNDDEDSVSESEGSEESSEIEDDEFSAHVPVDIEFLEQTSGHLENNEDVDQNVTLEEITRIFNYYNTNDGWRRAGTALGEAYDRCLNAYENRFPDRDTESASYQSEY